MHISSFSPSTGYLLAGTEAPWRWSNPPGSPAGTQRWASPQALFSSRSTSARAGILGSPLGMASCSHAPPGLTPRGSPYLEGEKERYDAGNRLTISLNHNCLWLLGSWSWSYWRISGTWRQHLKIVNPSFNLSDWHKAWKKKILAWIGHSAFSGQFSQQDPKWPDVRFDGEAAVQSSFGCCPLNGKLGSWNRKGSYAG